MPLYEHVFLGRQDISAQQFETLVDTYKTVISENGGEVGKTEMWGLKNLAFKIKKNRKAHFVLMNIEAPHAAVAEMERQMSLSTDVIRFLTLRMDELEDDPSPMMRRDDRRGGRGDRDRDRPPRRPRTEEKPESKPSEAKTTEAKPAEGKTTEAKASGDDNKADKSKEE